MERRDPAQELAPRAYWPAPTGTNVLVLDYQHSAGDIVTDPSLPIAGVKSNITFFPAIPHQRFISFSVVNSPSLLHFQHLPLYSESPGVASTG
jgi:hypothetical protein